MPTVLAHIIASNLQCNAFPYCCVTMPEFVFRHVHNQRNVCIQAPLDLGHRHDGIR